MLPFICFIVFHLGPANHFVTFAEMLQKQGYPVEILATGVARKKYPESTKELNPQGLDLENPQERQRVAERVASQCQQYDLIITDISHIFMRDLHLLLKNSPVKHFVYYDNPEKYIPNYFELGTEIAQVSDKVLFANKKLASLNLFPAVPTCGIGYYPVEHGLEIREKRKERIHREAFLKKHHLTDQGQKICVYFGANNRDYFEKALPLLLQILEETKEQNIIVLLQPHPGSIKENREALLLKGRKFSFPVFISDLTADQALLFADNALYFQTSLYLEFYLVGISSIIQIGHQKEPDLLVRNSLAYAVTDSATFVQALHRSDKSAKTLQETLQEFYSLIGYSPLWPRYLQEAIELCPKIFPTLQPKL